MAIPLAPIFLKAYFSLALFGGIYLLFVFALTFPIIQRNALYAHKVNPTLWEDLGDVEAFGFINYQVHPFTVTTPDNETLHAWHILPLHLAQEHSGELLNEDLGVKTSDDALDSVAFNLLASNPNAHVVVNFHGNAAHLASSYRSFTYQRFLGLSSKDRPVHVIAFDYRGFGLSTGTPTEDGLITDAEAILNFLTGVTPPPHIENNQRSLSLPLSNIILTSQSLGTAVSTALLHRWTLIHSLPPPKSLILTSAFSSLPSLIDSYSIKGLVPPILSPFRSYPFITNKITAYIADTWRTDQRLGELLTTDRDIPINIELVHAKDDREIPWWEAQRIWSFILQAVADTTGSAKEDMDSNEDFVRKGPGSQTQTWRSGSSTGNHEKLVRFTTTRHGGHNRLACSEEAAAAVWRALEL